MRVSLSHKYWQWEIGEQQVHSSIFYLCRIKYFKCKNSKTDADKGVKKNTVRSQQLASPLQRKAAQVLTKSLRKVRKVNRTIHVDLQTGTTELH